MARHQPAVRTMHFLLGHLAHAQMQTKGKQSSWSRQRRRAHGTYEGRYPISEKRRPQERIPGLSLVCSTPLLSRMHRNRSCVLPAGPGSHEWVHYTNLCVVSAVREVFGVKCVHLSFDATRQEQCIP